MQHAMVDLETLGTGADSVILSIGAVSFDLDGDGLDDNGFYASVSIESNLASSRKIDESTLLWWMKQDAAAQAVFTEPKQSLDSAMDSFSAWFAHSKCKYVWSNGADFDIPIMANAFRSLGWETPWEFYNTRCVRTYKNLPSARNVKVENAAKHNALSDAITQARLVQAVQKKLNTAHPMVKP